MPAPAIAAVIQLLPTIVTVGGAAAEIAFAWYDPDFYQRLWWDADLDDKVGQLNNDWHNLYRSARSAGHTFANSQPLRDLDAIMGRWWDWKTTYNKAIFRRAIPFGRDWDDELNAWTEEFHHQILVFSRDDAQVREQLAARGVDPDRDYPHRKPPTSPWVYWALAGGAVFVVGLGFVAYMVGPGRPRRR